MTKSPARIPKTGVPSRLDYPKRGLQARWCAMLHLRTTHTGARSVAEPAHAECTCCCNITGRRRDVGRRLRLFPDR